MPANSDCISEFDVPRGTAEKKARSEGALIKSSSVLMHSAGGVPYGRVCARKNEENEEMKIKGNKILIQKRLDVRRPRVTSGTSDCELLTTVLWPSKLVSLSRSYAARRRVWRMVGVGMRLLRHDREDTSLGKRRAAGWSQRAAAGA